ncbi:TIGR03757 family integrating conjugative element protein, partial [Xanthomonas vasicola]
MPASVLRFAPGLRALGLAVVLAASLVAFS